MKYIILSDGKGVRWNNYLEITKQEVMVGGERLLDRTIRMISERTNDEIYVLSSNAKHENKKAKRIVSKCDNYYRKKYAYDFINEPVIYLYGDTFYDDRTMDIIFDDNNDDICFYGNEYAIVGVKVKNYTLLKKILEDASENNGSLYHMFDDYSEYRNFINVGNGFVNINTPADYIGLVKSNKKMVLRRQKDDK